ncbi:hypothetical protein M3Y99_00676500 [Aphelenchoides fujianensis]|nr:hypothetical protein M3Y99_00676500 [Aphelenchoides fujianensis]
MTSHSWITSKQSTTLIIAVFLQLHSVNAHGNPAVYYDPRLQLQNEYGGNPLLCDYELRPPDPMEASGSRTGSSTMGASPPRFHNLPPDAIIPDASSLERLSSRGSLKSSDADVLFGIKPQEMRKIKKLRGRQLDEWAKARGLSITTARDLRKKLVDQNYRQRPERRAARRSSSSHDSRVSENDADEAETEEDPAEAERRLNAEVDADLSGNESPPPRRTRRRVVKNAAAPAPPTVANGGVAKRASNGVHQRVTLPRFICRPKAISFPKPTLPPALHAPDRETRAPVDRRDHPSVFQPPPLRRVVNANVAGLRRKLQPVDEEPPAAPQRAETDATKQPLPARIPTPPLTHLEGCFTPGTYHAPQRLRRASVDEAVRASIIETFEEGMAALKKAAERAAERPGVLPRVEMPADAIVVDDGLSDEGEEELPAKFVDSVEPTAVDPDPNDAQTSGEQPADEEDVREETKDVHPTDGHADDSVIVLESDETSGPTSSTRPEDSSNPQEPEGVDEGDEPNDRTETDGDRNERDDAGTEPHESNGETGRQLEADGSFRSNSDDSPPMPTERPQFAAPPLPAGHPIAVTSAAAAPQAMGVVEKSPNAACVAHDMLQTSTPRPANIPLQLAGRATRGRKRRVQDDSRDSDGSAATSSSEASTRAAHSAFGMPFADVSPIAPPPKSSRLMDEFPNGGPTLRFSDEDADFPAAPPMIADGFDGRAGHKKGKFSLVPAARTLLHPPNRVLLSSTLRGTSSATSDGQPVGTPATSDRSSSPTVHVPVVEAEQPQKPQFPVEEEPEDRMDHAESPLRSPDELLDEEPQIDPIVLHREKHGTGSPLEQLRGLAEVLFDCDVQVDSRRVADVTKTIWIHTPSTQRSRLLQFAAHQLELLGSAAFNPKHDDHVLAVHSALFVALDERTQIEVLEERRKDCLAVSERRRVILSSYLKKIMELAVPGHRENEVNLHLETNRCFQIIFQCACLLYFDSSPSVRAQAVHLLSVFQQENCACVRTSLAAIHADLRAVMRETANGRKRALGLQKIANEQLPDLPNLSIRNMIMARFSDESAEVRLAAIQSLRRRCTKDEAHLLHTRVMEDDQVEVRRAALALFSTTNLLNTMDQKHLVPLLMVAANSDDTEIQAAYTAMLTCFFDRKAAGMQRERPKKPAAQPPPPPHPSSFAFRVTLRVMELFDYFRFENATAYILRSLFHLVVGRRPADSTPLDEFRRWAEHTPAVRLTTLVREEVTPQQRNGLLFHWNWLGRFVHEFLADDPQLQRTAVNLFVPEPLLLLRYTKLLADPKKRDEDPKLRAFCLRQALNLLQVSTVPEDPARQMEERKQWQPFLYQLLAGNLQELEWSGMLKVFELFRERYHASSWACCLLLYRVVFRIAHSCPPFNVTAFGSGEFCLEAIIKSFKLPKYKSFILHLVYACQRAIQVTRYDRTFLAIIDLACGFTPTDTSEEMIMKYRLLSAAAAQSRERAVAFLPLVRESLLAAAKEELEVKATVIESLHDQLLAHGYELVSDAVRCPKLENLHVGRDPLVALVDEAARLYPTLAIAAIEVLSAQLVYVHVQYDLERSVRENVEQIEQIAGIRAIVAYFFSLVHSDWTPIDTRRLLFDELKAFAHSHCGQLILAFSIVDSVAAMGARWRPEGMKAATKRIRQFVRFVLPLVQLGALKEDPMERQFGGAEPNLLYATLNAMAAPQNAKNECALVSLLQVLKYVDQVERIDRSLLESFEKNLVAVDSLIDPELPLLERDDWEWFHEEFVPTMKNTLAVSQEAAKEPPPTVIPPADQTAERTYERPPLECLDSQPLLQSNAPGNNEGLNPVIRSVDEQLAAFNIFLPAVRTR